MYWIAAWIALLLLGPDLASAAAAPDCRSCHPVKVSGAHAEVACVACHGENAADRLIDELHRDNEKSCRDCHPDTEGVLHGPMARRQSEQDFVARSFGRADPDFFAVNCASCHVQSCLDCHGADGHSIARPQRDDCATCHRGYYVGADYYGLAPREDALRYQRGPAYGGEHYLKMRPDVHAEAGLECGDCHDMGSLAAGERSSSNCRDCHVPDPKVIEHGIAAHLERLECFACHSSWASQEYGTFFLRFTRSDIKDVFNLRDQAGKDYLKSAYLRRQDLPPLGLNAAGKVSPIRPQFIAYFSDIVDNHASGEENRLLAAEWKAFFPHTVRRGTPLCDACHTNPARFLLENPDRRIYQLERDGLGLSSFWVREGQRVSNGMFLPLQQYERMTDKSPEYIRKYVEKWKALVERVETSSP